MSLEAYRPVRLRIEQTAKLPAEIELDKYPNLIVLTDCDLELDEWTQFPYTNAIRHRLQRQNKTSLEPHTPFTFDLGNRLGTRLTIAAIKAESPTFDLLTLARKIVAEQLADNPHHLALYLAIADKKRQIMASEAILAACYAACAVMPTIKTKASPVKHLESIAIFGKAINEDFSVTEAAAAGNNLARFLTALPANYLTPALYIAEIAKLATEYQWDMQVYDFAMLQELQAGAFLAVAQGSATQDAGIVRLTYQPKKTVTKTKKTALALVGKGICFDTGGTNLKPARYMHGMHEDMQGSAVALGTLLALTQLNVNYQIDCWLAIAENHIGPKSYKQDDVVKALDGTSIEIIHTDAEGRMVLADTLALAVKNHPRFIIDYATLTGSCIQALSSRYSGAFTNRPDLLPDIIAAGQDSGERVWPFPIDEDFDSDLESQVADIKQCTLENEADHILASRFLARFITATPWLHLDLAAGNHKGGLAHIPTDITGFGIRFTLDLLLNKKVLQRSGIK